MLVDANTRDLSVTLFGVKYSVSCDFLEPVLPGCNVDVDSLTDSVFAVAQSPVMIGPVGVLSLFVSTVRVDGENNVCVTAP